MEVGTERVYEPEPVYDYKENNVFYTQQDNNTYELTVIMLQWTRSEQARAKLNPNMEKEGRQEVPPLAKGLLGFGSIWEESQFFLRLLPIVYWPHSSWRPHIKNISAAQIGH